MKIIDAHIHICEIIAGYCRRGEFRAIGNGKAAWANGDIVDLIPEGYGDTAYTAESALRMMDENGVEAGVILQGSMYGFQNLYIEKVIKQYPDRFVGACTIDPFTLNHLETLEHLLQWTSIVKFEVSSGGGLMGVHGGFPLDGSRMMEVYELINDKGGQVTIDFGDFEMDSYQPQAIANIAKRFPNMKLVMCHLLAPIPGHLDKMEAGLEILRADNIWFDLAALPKIAMEAYPYPSCQDALKRAKQIIGADRMMFGTDMPMALTKDSYQQLINYIPESGVFTDRELEDVFYNTAKKIYFNK